MTTPSLIAGVISGIAGLLVFLVIHHFWIAPIWFILPLGLVIASLGGLATGWAYAELWPGLPPRPWRSLALVALIGIILLPSFLLAELREPLFTITDTDAALSVGVGHAVVVFILELLATATVVGGIAGWLIGHTWRAALATAIAGFAFAFGLGHNIPLIGGTPGVTKEVAIMTAVIIVSALVLVETHHVLGGS